jgi:protein-S-isoprenylcysteine O-methyltransferase Ste14
MMTTEWQAIGAVYLPLSAALLMGLLTPRRPRQFAGCLLSMLWAVPSLLAVQAMNLRAGWWSFSGDSVRFHGMPLECFAGWAILWGVLPQLALPRVGRRFGFLGLVAAMIAIDLIAMPLCKPLVVLGPEWLVGEAIAAAVVLLPAILIAKWTMEGSHLHERAAMQIATSAMVFLYLLPEVAFALRPGEGWEPLLNMHAWLRQIELQTILLCALPGVSAVMEFALRGDGTPIPYDPPVRLVTSGIYSYCANPMQLSCAVTMLLWAGMLRNGWLALAAAVSVIYSAGLAEWDERQDLEQRFGGEWRAYRAEVRNWLPRWRPFHAGPEARIYLAASCGPCSEVWAWLKARRPVGLKILAAEQLPPGSIRRMRYAAPDGRYAVEGVRGMACALQHLNLGWALAGAALRLPGVWQLVQLLMDASGLGPRTIGAPILARRESCGEAGDR